MHDLSFWRQLHQVLKALQYECVWKGKETALQQLLNVSCIDGHRVGKLGFASFLSNTYVLSNFLLNHKAFLLDSTLLFYLSNHITHLPQLPLADLY